MTSLASKAIREACTAAPRRCSFDSSETFADAYEESAEGHGCKEIRRCETLAAEDVHFLKQTTQWPKLKSVARVTTTGTINDKTSTETRFYVSSLPPDAERIAKSVRAHWAIENSPYWILDVAFREDDAKVRKDHAPFNLAIIRHIALNLVQNVKKKGQSVRHLRVVSCGLSDSRDGVAFFLDGLDKIDRDMPDDGHHKGRIVLFDSALVFPERHVRYPMKGVFDAPMAPDGMGRCGRRRAARN